MGVQGGCEERQLPNSCFRDPLPRPTSNCPAAPHLFRCVCARPLPHQEVTRSAAAVTPDGRDASFRAWESTNQNSIFLIPALAASSAFLAGVMKDGPRIPAACGRGPIGGGPAITHELNTVLRTPVPGHCSAPPGCQAAAFKDSNNERQHELPPTTSNRIQTAGDKSDEGGRARLINNERCAP